MAGQPTLAVEIAFASNPGVSNPTWTNVTSFVRSLHTRRGRQFELDQIDAGTCDLVLNNSGREFDPTNTASPFYPNVLPMRELRVTATYSGTTYYLFRGYIERWPIHWQQPRVSEISLVATDAFHPLSMAMIDGTFPAELTGTRINRVLSAAQWPASTPQAGGYWTLGTSQLGTTTILSYGIANTVLDQGRTTLPAVTITSASAVSARSHLQDVADTEVGVVFIDGQGRVAFHDRHHRLKTTSQATFSDDSPTGSRLPYSDLVPSFDHDHLANEVSVTRQGGSEQVVRDAVSTNTYLRHTHSRAPMLATDAEAANMARYLLRRMKDAMLRFDSIDLNAWIGTVDASIGDSLWANVLGREISDRITVQRTPPGGGPVISKQVFIEQIEHSASPFSWQTRWQLSPADVETFWTLGTSHLGTGAETTLAY